MKKILAGLLFCCVMALGAAAQERAEFLFFYPADQTRLDPEYRDNAHQMEKLLEHLSSRERKIDSVRVYGCASPEGNLEWNQWLASRRGYTAFYYILNHTSVQRSQMQVIAAVGGDGLPRRSWRRGWLATLRYSRICVYSSPAKKPLSALRARPLAGLVTPSAFAAPLLTPPFRQELKTLVAVRSNLLFDALTAVNLGVSLPLGEHFSLDADLYFPWWHAGNRFALEYLSLDVEGRYWLKPRGKALTGHFLGLYGQVGKGDIQLGRSLCYQSPQFWSAGLRYGYSFPLSAKWNLELSAALGFARISYVHYIPADDWSLLWKDPGNEGVVSYFGPTGVSVSLVRTFWVRRRAGR